MGFLDRFKRSTKNDVTTMAREIAESVAFQWRSATTAMDRDGVLPLGRDISGMILVTRAKIKPLTEDEKATARRVLAEGFPETPLKLCKAIWEIEMESFLGLRDHDEYRELAYETMTRSIDQHELSELEPQNQDMPLDSDTFVEIARGAAEGHRLQVQRLGGSPESEGPFFAAVLSATLSMEPVLADEDPEDVIEIISNAAARACPDVYVHESKAAEFTHRVRAFIRSSLSFLSELREDKVAGRGGERALQSLREQHEVALLLAFDGVDPFYIVGLQTEVDQAVLRSFEFWDLDLPSEDPE